MASASVWSNIKNEVELLNLYPFLSKVAVDSPMPVPGYLFHEINALTYVEDGANCKQLIKYFVCKLQSDSPVVKIKVLKMVLHLVRNGHKKVSEEARFHEIALKQSAGISEPLDSVHPRAHYENVRKLAKEILEVVFSENESAETLVRGRENIVSGVQKMAGYGSQASHNKMSGFGSTSDTSKSIGGQFSEGLSSFVDKLLTPKDKRDYYRQQATVLEDSLPKYTPITIKKSSEQEGSLQSESSPTTKVPATALKTFSRTKRTYVAGKAGGGWEDDDDEEEENATRRNGSTSVKDSTDQSEYSDSQERAEALLCSEWAEEQKIVDEFAVDLPLSKIQYDEMTVLTEKCSHLNCDKIMEMILNKITSKEAKEIVLLRCLFLLEFFLLNDVLSPDSFEQSAVPKLEKLSTSAGASVQAKAKKLSLMNQCLCKRQETCKQKFVRC